MKASPIDHPDVVTGTAWSKAPVTNHNQEPIMKYLFVSAVVLLSACSTVQPTPTDPFAHLCPAQSSESCPGDSNTPIVLSGPRRAQS